MKKHVLFATALAVLTVFTSCSKEVPADVGGQEVEAATAGEQQAVKALQGF